MSAMVLRSKASSRRGAIAALAAILLVFLLGMIAFAIDLGYIMLTNAQLQNAADSSALAAAAFLATDTTDADTEARRFACLNEAGGFDIEDGHVETEFGTWDAGSESFSDADGPGNAIRVTVTMDDLPLFFAPVFGKLHFDTGAQAVAMSNPRDIAFVVDLSGSMNNDTEPCWATGEINSTFGPEGYPTVGDELMQQLYDDFDFGAYPGDMQYVGQPLGIAQDQYAYAELTKNGGKLTLASVPATYRIQSTNNEATRRQKAYKWLIDNQIATLMPNAKPVPNSANSASYEFWSRYLDFIIRSQQITSSSPKGKPRPSYPVTLPPSQSSDRITGFGNPYADAFPDADASVPSGYRNQIGYRTYAQFMMDFGRDKQPASGQYVPLSQHSADCPWHDEATEGGVFSFPPREQPTHAARRALIAALQVIKDRNEGVTNVNERDWVSVITFDREDGVVFAQSLTSDYDDAMLACTTLQAVADDALSTATESGLLAAKQHIAPPEEGGEGRRHTNKVVVFLTDGIPNLYSSSSGTIAGFKGANPSDEWMGNNSCDAALMQCWEMQLKKWQTFPVGVGLGTNYDFMDRAARLSQTDNEDGEAPRGSGNPAEYEQRLKDIFENIICNPKARLVQ
jgi:hypothetical protein